MEMLPGMDVHKKGITILVCAKHRWFWGSSIVHYSKGNIKPNKYLKNVLLGY